MESLGNRAFRLKSGCSSLKLAYRHEVLISMIICSIVFPRSRQVYRLVQPSYCARLANPNPPPPPDDYRISIWWSSPKRARFGGQKQTKSEYRYPLHRSKS